VVQNYFRTCFFFYFFSACLLLVKQYQDPIVCATDGEMSAYIHSYCWVYALRAWDYFKSCSVKPHTYFWAPLLLLVLSTVQLIPHHWLSDKTHLIGWFLTCILVYLYFGFHAPFIAGREFLSSPDSPRNDTNWCYFPKIARCNIETFGPSGTMQLRSYICTLNYNLYIEKISFICAISTIFGLVISLYLIWLRINTRLRLSVVQDKDGAKDTTLNLFYDDKTETSS
jgi:hypothetical protein